MKIDQRVCAYLCCQTSTLASSAEALTAATDHINKGRLIMATLLRIMPLRKRNRLAKSRRSSYQITGSENVSDSRTVSGDRTYGSKWGGQSCLMPHTFPI